MYDFNPPIWLFTGIAHCKILQETTLMYITIMPALLMLARFYSVPDQSLMLDNFLQNSRYIKCHQHVKTCLLMNMSLIKERVY